MSLKVLVRGGGLSTPRHRMEKYFTHPQPLILPWSKRTQLISLKRKVPLRDNSCRMMSHVVGKSLQNTLPSNHLRHGHPGGLRYCILIAVIINSCIWLLESQTLSLYSLSMVTGTSFSIVFYFILTDKWLISTISISPWKWPWISVFPSIT